jgi:hypothetical protein
LKSVTSVTTEPVDLTGVNEGFSLIVPLVHLGTYTSFKDEKTTEVQVEIRADEPPPATANDATETNNSAVDTETKVIEEGAKQ